MKQRNRVKVTKKCKVCKNSFETYPSLAKTRMCCSDKCARTMAQNSNKTGSYKSCEHCSSKMYCPRWNSDKKYCSKVCTVLAGTDSDIELKCQFCKIAFYRKPYIAKTTKFCSVKCLCQSNNASGKPFVRKTNTKPEQAVKKILSELNIRYRSSFRVKYDGTVKFYDLYVPSLNVLIEVDGTYWHGKNKKRSEMDKVQIHNRKNDILKNKIAKKLGYKLIRIWSDEISLEKLQTLLK